SPTRSASDDHTVPVRQKESYDGAEPTANSISALNLLRLGELTGKEEFSNKAEELFSSFGTTLASQSHALPQMLVALNFARKQKSRIVFSGDLHAPEMERLRAVAGERYLPGTVVMHASEELAALQEFSETIPPGASNPQAAVCIDRTCHLPVSEPAELAELLLRVQLRSFIP
ncbi:MAG: thioredoxin domain-containing protein, partial [Chlorobiaceae bacterium]|nr:thioredoxin domain-containing protein [Chlorobiaceae bacterium]